MQNEILAPFPTRYSPFAASRVLKEKKVRLYGDAPQLDEASRVGGVGWAGERMKAELLRMKNAPV
jgi:hypothetical protein